MVSDSRWFTVEMPTPLWAALRDRVVRPAELEALRAGPGHGPYSWLRDAWRHVEHEGSISRVRLDKELAILLIEEVRQRESAAVPDVLAVLPERYGAQR